MSAKMGFPILQFTRTIRIGTGYGKNGICLASCGLTSRTGVDLVWEAR